MLIVYKLNNDQIHVYKLVQKDKFSLLMILRLERFFFNHISLMNCFTIF